MRFPFHRPLIADDVETAHRHLDHHLPLDDHADRPVCASAVHFVGPVRWPCAQRHWAEAVLAAHARGEIPDA